MVTIRVIPCLLLQYGSLVMTTRFRAPRYVGEPVDAVRAFNATGAGELLLLDITASHARGLFRQKADIRPDFDLIARLSDESFVPVACGGGVRTIEDIRDLLSRGVDKVLINTRAVEDPSFVGRAAGVFGGRHVAVSIDARRLPDGRYEVCTGGGARPSGIDPVGHAKRMEALGAGEIYLNAIDRDGTRQGYDLALVQAVARSVGIPVTACGGAGSVDDFGAAIRAGAAAAVASSVFVFHCGQRAALIDYPAWAEIVGAPGGAAGPAVAQDGG